MDWVRINVVSPSGVNLVFSGGGFRDRVRRKRTSSCASEDDTWISRIHALAGHRHAGGMNVPSRRMQEILVLLAGGAGAGKRN